MVTKKAYVNCKNTLHWQEVHQLIEVIRQYKPEQLGTIIEYKTNNKGEVIIMGKVKELMEYRFENNLDRLSFNQLSAEEEEALMGEVLRDADKMIDAERYEERNEAYLRGVKDTATLVSVSILIIGFITYLVTSGSL